MIAVWEPQRYRVRVALVLALSFAFSSLWPSDAYSQDPRGAIQSILEGIFGQRRADPAATNPPAGQSSGQQQGVPGRGMFGGFGLGRDECLSAMTRGQMPLAEEPCKRNLAREEQSRPGSMDHVRALFNLANVVMGLGRHQEAETYLLKALALQQERISRVPQEMTSPLDIKASLVRATLYLGKFGQADDFIDQIVADIRNDPRRQMLFLNQLISYLVTANRWAKAERLSQEAVALVETTKIQGYELNALQILSMASSVFAQQGRKADAEAAIRRALALAEQVEKDRRAMGAGQGSGVGYVIVLGHAPSIYMALGNLDEAESSARRFTQLIGNLPGNNADTIAANGGILASVYLKQGKLEDLGEVQHWSSLRSMTSS